MKKQIIILMILALLIIGCSSTKEAENHVNHEMSSVVKNSEYLVALHFNSLQSSQQNEIRIQIKNASNQEILSNLEVEHEKKLHVFLVSSDLEQFMHLHSEDETNEVFTITPYFESGGNWTVFTEWKHNGKSNYDLQKITVNGTIKPSKDKDFSTIKTNEAYSVSMNTEHEQNEKVKFTFEIQKNNNTVTDLQNYLGAPMHIAIWKDDFSYFTHTHGKLNKNQVHAIAEFPKSGEYKIWIQFKHDNKVQTFDHWLNVEDNHEEK